MSNSIIEIVGVVAGSCTAVSLLPQLVKLIKTKKAEDLSVLYLITLFVGLSMWIWYGALRKDLPIIVTNIVSLVLNVSILILGLRYKRMLK